MKGKTPVQGTLKMKPHLYNFLQNHLHIGPEEPLRLPGDSSYSLYLDNLLINKTAVRDDPRQGLCDSYKMPLLFELDATRAQRANIFLSPTRVIRFNSYVHYRMHELLNDLILVQHDQGQKETSTIFFFMGRFCLYDHVTFDALKRASSRFRAKRNHPRLSKKVPKSELYFA